MLQAKPALPSRSARSLALTFLLSNADSMEGSVGLGDRNQGSNTSRPTTGIESIMSDMESSRPVTGVSDVTASRPGTTASSFIHDDDEGETRSPAQAMEVSEDEKHAFFSLVRHNKVPEVEDKVHTHTRLHTNVYSQTRTAHFSLVRHNTALEVEDKVHAHTRMCTRKHTLHTRAQTQKHVPV